MFELTVESDFSSAHRLRGYSGNCERLHGHSWSVQVTVGSEQLDEIGLVVDFKLLRKILRDITGELDHCLINEHEDFQNTNPTCENIARWLYERMKRELRALPCNLRRVRVWESKGSFCTYREDGL
ncbi:6-carboxytetrahydropterin synthase QueD [bacterium]|nr:6-carboxytetrahydropterin synthase QueD [candidate division CSSED10-310 bacterium]